MGTRAQVIVAGPERLVDLAVARIEDLEQAWSRFRASSELNWLNARSGTPTRVSAETRLLVERAVAGWWLSGGAFDPTVLGDVIRAGYDRSFEEGLDGRGEAGRVPERPSGAGCGGVRVVGEEVHLPAGVGIDSGGIGKGLAADLVAAELLEAGAEGVCVNLGGDLRTAGRIELGGSGGVTVGVEHEWKAAGPLALVGLASGGMATSTTLRRSWTSGGERRHHLIDPRSHAPAESGVNHVTVIAGEAWRAEVLAKAVLINGGPHLFDILGGTGAEAVAVTDDGAVVATAGFSCYLGEASLETSVERG